mgnify:CR=1 FL=1
MKSGLTMRLDKSADILKALKAIGKKDVLVGIPESENVRDGDDIGNAAIGFINENGSPARNIPARPHLVLGVRGVQSETLPLLKSAAQAVLRGNDGIANRYLNQAGTLAMNAVKAYITNTAFVPLSPSTIRQRLSRGRAGDKPLIDTGKYRDSITYIVRDKDADS